MKKPKRVDLIKIICQKTGLPEGKTTEGFFTREQLIELAIWVTSQVDNWVTFQVDKKESDGGDNAKKAT